MWLTTTYEMVSPLSLKLSTATSTGGKSLLLPTPFAFKMALLDRAILHAGLDAAQEMWPALRDTPVAVRGPEHITVNNTFARILKPARGKPATDPLTGMVAAMTHTIAFREYVLWQGACSIAIHLDDRNADGETPWARWLTGISYLGKRGGFVQAMDEPVLSDDLGAGFTSLTESADEFSLEGTLQVMDDCGPSLSFEQVNVYTSKTIRLGKDRILRHIVLPYRMERSSRGYTYYRYLDVERRVA